MGTLPRDPSFPGCCRGVRPAGEPVSGQAAARSRRRSAVGLLGGAGVLALVDLGLKTVAQATLAGGRMVDLGWINFRVFYNPGVAFSLGSSLPSWVVIAGTGAIIAVLVWYLLTAIHTMTGVARTGATLLLGGAVGNFLDRLDGAGVVDYLHTGWFPTFNAADVFVTVGVAGVLLGTLGEPRSRPEDQ